MAGGRCHSTGGKSCLACQQPPRKLRDMGSGAISELLHQPCCYKCHNTARSQPAPACGRLVPHPWLSPEWFSLVCFLCHTVQSLGFGGGARGAVLYKSN